MAIETQNTDDLCDLDLCDTQLGVYATHDLHVINICVHLFHFICAQFKSNQHVKLTWANDIL